MEALLFLIVVLIVVLGFTYTNGFHDAANAIATVVSTKVLTPRQAVMLAAVFNFIGALGGTAVAKTIGSGMVDAQYITVYTVFCAMMAGIFWNVLTWYFGIPSSSSHALIGGLLGAAVASAKNNWGVILWSFPKTDPKTGAVAMEGVYHKVVIPMISSPIMGFVVAYLIMGVLFAIVRNWRPVTVNRVFGNAQIVSATYMGWAHGFADGQKTMGIMALALFAAGKSVNWEIVPSWLQFLHTPTFEIATWVKWSCGLTMAAGTYIGGWKIIHTLGHKLVRIKPIHGFAAECTGATILYAAGALGMPVSTTHCITTSIMGVGCARRFSALNYTLVERILWTWVFTIPATGAIAYLLMRLMSGMGWSH
ncbi:MAG: inorganic phosphate transporter [Verrucomicrobiaceae bacterium]|nr:inorganic phosphate transporter [Verrucomicrobiaceae bacterium]